MQRTWKSRRASLACSTVLVAAGVTSAAHAAEFEVNEDITITTNVTISTGISFRTEDASSESIFAGNGALVNQSGVAASATQDDGNLNFEKGDIVSAPITVVGDAEFNYRDDIGFFIRGKAVYDAALENRDVPFGHTPNAFEQGARLNDEDFNTLAQFSTVAVLDAFVFGDVEVGDVPVDLRGGRQVVSWGEGVFIQNGINSINPIDVTAFRRPGVQLKEGLLPLGMLYGNAGLTDNLSLEAFWNFEWQQTQLDGCGTFFSTVDIAAQGCNALSLATLGPAVQGLANPGIQAGIDQLNTAIGAVSGALATGSDAVIIGTLAAVGVTVNPGDDPTAVANATLEGFNAQLAATEGLQAGVASLSNDGGALANGFFLARGRDVGPDDFDFDNFGISPRYYVPSLDTEFGFYFTRLDSRSPIVSYTAGAPTDILGGALPLPFQVSFGTDPTAATYNLQYEENIHTLGLSAATTLFGLAVAGEVSYRPDHPVQINTNDLTLAAISLGQSANLVGPIDNPADQLFAGVAPGSLVEGFISTNQVRGQGSVVAFFDRVLGADRVTAIGELGFEWLPTLDDDNPLGLNLGRASIYGNPGTSGNNAEGLTDAFSMGFRSRVSAAYTNVFAGVNMTPSLSWSQDILGESSDSQFIEGRTTLGFGLAFDYLNRYSLSLNYTREFGGTFNGFDDRDFASAAFSVQF